MNGLLHADFLDLFNTAQAEARQENAYTLKKDPLRSQGLLANPIKIYRGFVVAVLA